MYPTHSNFRPTRFGNRPIRLLWRVGNSFWDIQPDSDGSIGRSLHLNPISIDLIDSTTNEAVDPHRIYDFSVAYRQIRRDSIPTTFGEEPSDPTRLSYWSAAGLNVGNPTWSGRLRVGHKPDPDWPVVTLNYACQYVTSLFQLLSWYVQIMGFYSWEAILLPISELRLIYKIEFSSKKKNIYIYIIN